MRFVEKLFWGILVIIAFEAFGFFSMKMSSPTFDWLSNNNYFRIREMLLGNKNPEHFPRYLSLPYLGYIPYPNYKKHKVVQHNEDGYRGEKVPLAKKKYFLRILCIGGSTTYGFSVDSPLQTYPAQLERMMSNTISGDTILNKKYKGTEVINAGLEAGNTAEELQQYLFKYRYYHPDIVIVHSGVNDAFLVHTSQSNFQLDYTHARRINFHVEPLPFPASWLMKSYFWSFISIKLFYREFTANTIGFENQTPHTFCKWTSINIDSIIQNRNFDYYPFYRNTISLYSEIVRDSSILVVLPTPLNKNSNSVKSRIKYLEANNLNEEITRDLAKVFGAIYVPFDYDSIKNKNNWTDDCHLNADGERNKAELLLPFILSAIRNKSY